MDDLDRILRWPDLLPKGWTARPLGPREYSLTLPDQQGPIRVTTDADYFERHPDSVTLWSPGGRGFPTEVGAESEWQEWGDGATLKAILDGMPAQEPGL